MAIEPLVSGQQLIALPRAGTGKASWVNCKSSDRFATFARFALLCFALQQACAFIEFCMPGIGDAAARADESVSLIVLA